MAASTSSGRGAHNDASSRLNRADNAPCSRMLDPRMILYPWRSKISLIVGMKKPFDGFGIKRVQRAERIAAPFDRGAALVPAGDNGLLPAPQELDGLLVFLLVERGEPPLAERLTAGRA